MQPTPRLRDLSDRIRRVLVFVYFCKGLSGNMEERPTCWVYIEILTCRAIFHHLEDSRSHGNEREADRAWGQGARPPPWAPTHLWWPIRVNHADYAPPPLGIEENRSIKVSLIRRPIFIWRGYISRHPGPWRRIPHYSLAYFLERIQRERFLRVPTS